MLHLTTGAVIAVEGVVGKVFEARKESRVDGILEGAATGGSIPMLTPLDFVSTFPFSSWLSRRSDKSSTFACTD